MISEAEVRDQLAAMLSGSISLADFQKWLMPRSWNMHRDSQPRAIELIESIDLLLGESQHAEWSEDVLLRELRSVLNNIHAQPIAIHGEAIEPAVSYQQLAASLPWLAIVPVRRVFFPSEAA